jgi:hypothetical protein
MVIEIKLPVVINDSVVKVNSDYLQNFDLIAKIEQTLNKKAGYENK